MTENKPHEFPDTLTDRQWDAVEALLPLIGKSGEWEVSRNRHRRRCLWEREEDAPFLTEEALRALSAAIKKPLSEYALPEEQRAILSELFERES